MFLIMDFPFASAFKSVLGPTQPLVRWELWVLPMGIKQPGCEVDHSPESIAKVKNE
jgi:hypothetical protein